MRRSWSRISLILTLALIALAGAGPGLVSAQDQDRIILGPDITAKQLPPPNGQGKTVTAWSLDFGPQAFIPEQQYPQPVIVQVVTGRFAFRVQSDVLIDNQGKDIQLVQADPDIPVGGDPAANAHGRTFNPVGVVTLADCAPASGATWCRFDPTVVAAHATPTPTPTSPGDDNLIQLDAGASVYIPAKTECFLCNTTDMENGSNGSQGTLLMWVPTGFQIALAADQQVAAAPGGLRAVVRLNPGSPCH